MKGHATARLFWIPTGGVIGCTLGQQFRRGLGLPGRDGWALTGLFARMPQIVDWFPVPLDRL